MDLVKADFMGALMSLVQFPFKLAGMLVSWLAPEPLAPEWPKLRHDLSQIPIVGVGVRVDPSVRLHDHFGMSIGNDVVIGAGCYIDAQGGVIVGSGAQLGDGVRILSSRPAPVRNPELSDERVWAEVFIGQDAKIGARARIMPGVSIGAGAIIGPGAVVEHDVPAHGRHGVADKPLPAIRIAPGPQSAFPATDPSGARPLSGREKPPNICFIATTGRSGSAAIVNALQQHGHVIAKHEPRFQLVKLSTDYSHGLVSRDYVKQRLERLYLDGSVFHPDRIYVESDQKFFNLIPILNEIMPEARFVWLMRIGHDVVASTYARSWFADSTHPTWRKVAWYYHKYRLAGDKAGAMSAQQWADMSVFERNCWYWAYVNETIEGELAAIAPERKMFVRLRDLGANLTDLLAFLGAPGADLSLARTNTAFYDKVEIADWTAEQKDAFQRICGPLMQRFYS